MKRLLFLIALAVSSQQIKINPITGLPDLVGSGGGGSGAAPYDAAVAAQTTLSVTASTHGQGTSPIATCYEGTSPFIATACYYTKATNGDLVFTWSPAFTGRVVVIGSGAGPAGATGATGATGPSGLLSGLLSAIPGTCTAGASLYQATDQPITTQLYSCTSANTWTRAAYTQGTSAPGTCSIGQLFFDTDATAGSNLQVCTSANTWTTISGVGGSVSFPADARTTTSEALTSADCTQSVTFFNASAITVSLPASPLSDGCVIFTKNIGAGNATIMPISGTISGQSSITLSTGESATIKSNGTNYEAEGSLTVDSALSITRSRTSQQIGVGATVVTLSGTQALTNKTVTDSTNSVGPATIKDNCQDAGSTDAYACSIFPAITAYVTGNHYRFKANTANTGAATIAFNGLSAITIKKAAGGITTDLVTNDILAGQWVDLIHDGTNMQMQSLLGNAPGGSGTVTSASVVSANGFAGTVATATTTPAITLTTPITGILKGNGTAISAASSGTDYVVPSGSVATLTTPRAIYGNNFDGSAALTQIIASTYGGTGNGFTKFSGPTSSEKTFTLPDASATLTQTIASGTKALDTDAIASGACDTLATTTATGTASTDVVTFTANADITGVTGYAPVTTGGLAIYVWPTTNTINWKVCNPTSSSITPGAVTLNYRVTR